MARTAAAAGDLDQAQAIAQAITNPYRQAEALADVARAAAAAGDLDRAQAIARAIPDQDRQAEALENLARAAAAAGDLDGRGGGSDHHRPVPAGGRAGRRGAGGDRRG